MSFSPREAMRKISVVFDIYFSRKLNRTLEKTAELIASLGLTMPGKAVCSAGSSSVRQA